MSSEVTSVTKKFDVGPAIRQGRLISRQSAFQLVGFALLLESATLVPIVSQILTVSARDAWLHIFLTVVTFGWAMFLTPIWLQKCMQAARKPFEFLPPWPPRPAYGLRMIWDYSCMSIVTSFLTTVGFLLFIFPGIILTVRLSLAPFILVEERVDAQEAMKRSFAMTKGVVGPLFWFYFRMGIVTYFCNFIPVIGPAFADMLYGPTKAVIYLRLTEMYAKQRKRRLLQ